MEAVNNNNVNNIKEAQALGTVGDISKYIKSVTSGYNAGYGPNKNTFLGMNNPKGDGLLGTVGQSVDATGSLLTAISNLAHRRRKPLEEIIGLPYVNAYGGYIPNYYDLGGYAEVGNTALALAGNALENAQIKDTKGIMAGIAGAQRGNQAFASLDELANQWENQRRLNHISPRDLREQSLFGDFANSLQASGQGFTGGSNFGKVGAIAGGILGGISSVAGSIAGRIKARKMARKVNKFIDSTNKWNVRSLVNTTTNTLKNMTRNLQANSKAFGGDLFNTGNALEYDLSMQFLNNQKNKQLANQKFSAMPNSFMGADAFAKGGYSNGYGANFSNGMTYINEGGTHEQNRYGGVQQGMAQDGAPQLVEEGEVVVNLPDGKYVFSNRHKAPKEVRERFKLSKNATMADAAKKAGKESSERENDPISKNGLNVDLVYLRDVQERLNALQQAEQYKEQIQQSLDMMSPEDFLALQEQQAQQQDPYQQQQMMDGMYGMSGMQDMQGIQDMQQVPVRAYGGPIHQLAFGTQNPLQFTLPEPTDPPGSDDDFSLFSDYIENVGGNWTIKDPDNRIFYNEPLSVKTVGDTKLLRSGDIDLLQYSGNKVTPLAAFTIGSSFNPSGQEIKTAVVSAPKPKPTKVTGVATPTQQMYIKDNNLLNWRNQNPHDFNRFYESLSPDERQQLLQNTFNSQDISRINSYRNNDDYYTGEGDNRVFTPYNLEYTPLTEQQIKDPYYTNALNDRQLEDDRQRHYSITMNKADDDYAWYKRYQDWLENNPEEPKVFKPEDTSLRKIQPLGNLLGAIMASHVDHTNPDKIASAAGMVSQYDRVGTAPEFSPMTYNPFGEDYYTNMALANSAAQMRSNENMQSLNKGSLEGMNLAQNYNTILGLSDLALKGRQYNDDRQKIVDEFNTKGRLAERQQAYEEQAANQRARMQAAEKAASLYERSATLDQAIKDASEQALGKNMKSFFDNLGEIAKERATRNMINSQNNLYYSIGDDGTITYKGSYYSLSPAEQWYIQNRAQQEAKSLNK